MYLLIVDFNESVLGKPGIYYETINLTTLEILNETKQRIIECGLRGYIPIDHYVILDIDKGYEVIEEWYKSNE